MSVTVEKGTHVGVGFSELPDSREAGAAAARSAVGGAGLEAPDLVLVVATSKHDPVALRDGVRAVVGPEARLFGGSAVGVITNDQLGYAGFQVGVAALVAPGTDVEMLIEPGLADSEHAVGLALGRQLAARSFAAAPNVVLLYDLIKRSLPGVGTSFNMATPLIAGLSEELGELPATVGGGMMGDVGGATPTFQLFDDRIEQQSATALVLTGDVRMDTIIMHGCTPSSRYYTITKADGNVVLELEGRPVLDVISELVGSESDRSWEEYPEFITLGVNKGDRFGEVRDDDYAVRLTMAVDKERGGLVMFGDDLQPGVVVQLMRRTLDLDYVERRSHELLERIGDRMPLLALYIDCAGRAGAYCGTDWEEAAAVQDVVGARMPLIGWYVGCELAKAGGGLESHNWTGVLSVLSCGPR